MKTIPGLRLALLVPLALAAPLRAINIVDSGASGPGQVNLGGTYTQNFDSLQSSTPFGGSDWFNDSTIPGWYSTQTRYYSNEYMLGGGLGSFGTDSDRAFGSRNAYWALRFANNSSETITGFQISFTGEQWYRGANSPQQPDQIFCYYRVYDSTTTEIGEIEGIGGINDWTATGDLGFFSPNSTLSSASFLDGNAPENQVSVSFFLPVTLAPGQKLWLKWISSDRPSFDDSALAMDDLSVGFSTIPEPASATALLGCVALLFANRRRHRT